MKTKVRPDRDKFIAFYVTSREKEAIVEAAKTRDMSISDYCRRVLLSGDLKQAESAFEV